MFPPMVGLSQEERLFYCDEEFFRLIRIFMINDSLSYMYVFDEGDKNAKCVDEFKLNSSKMLSEWE